MNKNFLCCSDGKHDENDENERTINLPPVCSSNNSIKEQVVNALPLLLAHRWLNQKAIRFYLDIAYDCIYNNRLFCSKTIPQFCRMERLSHNTLRDLRHDLMKSGWLTTKGAGGRYKAGVYGLCFPTFKMVKDLIDDYDVFNHTSLTIHNIRYEEYCREDFEQLFRNLPDARCRYMVAAELCHGEDCLMAVYNEHTNKLLESIHPK